MIRQLYTSGAASPPSLTYHRYPSCRSGKLWGEEEYNILLCATAKVSLPPFACLPALFTIVASLKNLRVLQKNMLFLQSYDELLSRTLHADSLYSLCGPVDKVKAKQNFKNHTAYVTFRHP